MMNSGEKNSMQLEFFPRFKTKQTIFATHIQTHLGQLTLCSAESAKDNVLFVLILFRASPSWQISRPTKDKGRSKSAPGSMVSGQHWWSTEGTEGLGVRGSSSFVSCGTPNQSLNLIDISLCICKMGDWTRSGVTAFYMRPSLITQVVFLLPFQYTIYHSLTTAFSSTILIQFSYS